MAAAAPLTPPCPVDVLNEAGARQWTDSKGQWVISIPRRNDRPSVQWALREMSKSAGELPCVLWVKRRE